jgi:hypothetical protein
MFRTRVLPALLTVTLSVSVVSSAEARKWRWSFFPGFYVYGHSVRSGDRARRARVATPAVETARARTGGGAFGAVVERLNAACLQQTAELQSWPFDRITQVVSPDDAQRSALEALRASATTAAGRFSTECPRDEPAPPWARLEATEQAIATVASTYTAVEPALRAFYAALDDEQKARLMRDMMQSRSQAREGDRTEERRSGRRHASTDRRAGEPGLRGICEDLVSALRAWPVREIERRVRLSEPQRADLYELVTASLKAAETLAEKCPAETALTPPARMSEMRARLVAVRQATTAIRPAFTHFYDALDQGQKVRFAAMH